MAIFDCYRGSGEIRYPAVSTSETVSQYPNGGTNISGTIWSSVRQIIWIKMDNMPKYPVYLEPGNNEVSAVIPNISPEDKKEDTTLEIEASGYILIPMGFVFTVIDSPKAPEVASNQTQIDSFKIEDLFEIEIQSIIPVDIDSITDDFSFEDVYETETITVTYLEDQISGDDFSFEDVYETETITVTYLEDQINIDDFSLEDVYEIEFE